MAKLFTSGSSQYKAYGPFDSVSDADRWAEENLQYGHEIIQIQSVESNRSRPPDPKRGDSGGGNVSRTFAWNRLWERAPQQPPPTPGSPQGPTPTRKG